MANYGADGPLPAIRDEEPESHADDSAAVEPESAPDPWYRNRVLLALWALLVAVLIVLIIYGLVELSRGGAGGGPSTTTPSTTTTRSSTTSATTTTPSTTTPPPPPPETPEQTPEQTPGQVPPSGGYSPAPAEPPRHHHHLPHVPSTITLPRTVVTLPPGF
jgi:cytoskeletal protein RodZ